MFAPSFHKGRNFTQDRSAPTAAAAAEPETAAPKPAPKAPPAMKPTNQAEATPSDDASTKAIRRIEAVVTDVTRELKELRTRLDATEGRLRELNGSMAAFSQQVATIKPAVVYAKELSDEELRAFMDDFASEAGRVLTVGATWCSHCKKMLDALQYVSTGAKTAMLYADMQDGSVDGRVRSLLGGLSAFPTTYITTGTGFRKLREGAMTPHALNELVSKQ